MERQHGVISRRQLIDRGLTPKAIEHRVAIGRLRPLYRGIYSTDRDPGRHGEFMAAVLACGPRAVLSQTAAGELWGMVARTAKIHTTSPSLIRVNGVVAHRRHLQPNATTRRHNIPVTRPLPTLIDLATQLTQPQLEAAVNEADKLNLIRAHELPALLARSPRRPGLAALKAVAATHQPTDSDLERRFLALVGRAGLPIPLTQQSVSGFKVDFFWPDWGLVVETDGLIYHRTSAQQSRDRARDQAHAAAGLTQLRFSNDQIRNEPEHVLATLQAVIGRLEQAA